MNQLLTVFVALILTIHIAQAADEDKKKDKGKGGIQVLLTQLDLTPEQQKKIDEFNKAHQEKYDQGRKLKELKAAKKGKKEK